MKLNSIKYAIFLTNNLYSCQARLLCTLFFVDCNKSVNNNKKSQSKFYLIQCFLFLISYLNRINSIRFFASDNLVCLTSK